MSGVAVIWHLLKTATEMTAVVPAARIKSGVLPIGIDLPAIAVTFVTATRRNSVSMSEAQTLVTERVQVTLMAKTYPSLSQILTLARQACPNSRGTINDVVVLSVLPDIEGPDLPMDDIGVQARSQDFIVQWAEAR